MTKPHGSVLQSLGCALHLHLYSGLIRKLVKHVSEEGAHQEEESHSSSKLSCSFFHFLSLSLSLSLHLPFSVPQIPSALGLSHPPLKTGTASHLDTTVYMPPCLVTA